jgi:hypothetical protein
VWVRLPPRGSEASRVGAGADVWGEEPEGSSGHLPRPFLTTPSRSTLIQARHQSFLPIRIAEGGEALYIPRDCRSRRERRVSRAGARLHLKGSKRRKCRKMPWSLVPPPVCARVLVALSASLPRSTLHRSYSLARTCDLRSRGLPSSRSGARERVGRGSRRARLLR